MLRRCSWEERLKPLQTTTSRLWWSVFPPRQPSSWYLQSESVRFDCESMRPNTWGGGGPTDIQPASGYMMDVLSLLHRQQKPSIKRVQVGQFSFEKKGNDCLIHPVSGRFEVLKLKANSSFRNRFSPLPPALACYHTSALISTNLGGGVDCGWGDGGGGFTDGGAGHHTATLGPGIEKINKTHSLPWQCLSLSHLIFILEFFSLNDGDGLLTLTDIHVTADQSFEYVYRTNWPRFALVECLGRKMLPWWD